MPPRPDATRPQRCFTTQGGRTTLVPNPEPSSPCHQDSWLHTEKPETQSSQECSFHCVIHLKVNGLVSIKYTYPTSTCELDPLVLLSALPRVLKCHQAETAGPQLALFMRIPANISVLRRHPTTKTPQIPPTAISSSGPQRSYKGNEAGHSPAPHTEKLHRTV